MYICLGYLLQLQQTTVFMFILDDLFCGETEQVSAKVSVFLFCHLVFTVSVNYDWCDSVQYFLLFIISL